MLVIAVTAYAVLLPLLTIVCSTFGACFEHFVVFKPALANGKQTLLFSEMVGEQPVPELALALASETSEVKVGGSAGEIEVTASQAKGVVVDPIEESDVNNEYIDIE
jgi:hypothetical protein